MKIRNSGGAGVLSHTIKVYQNSRSNRLLNWIHDTLVASGQYWCTPVADLLLSLFIMHNCVQQQDKSGYLDGKKRYRPKLDIPVNLNELAQQVYPKGCQATAIGRSRTAWANRFLEACTILCESGIILHSFNLDTETGILELRYLYHFGKWGDVNQPSPIDAPVCLYRFQRGRNKIPVYAFMLLRKMLVHYKMNQQPDMPVVNLPIETFCRITGIPKPTEWTSNSNRIWNEGIQKWYERCVERSADHYGMLVPSLYGDRIFIGAKQ